MCDETILRKWLPCVGGAYTREGPHSIPPLKSEEERTHGGPTFEKKEKPSQMGKWRRTCTHLSISIHISGIEIGRDSETQREAEKRSMLKWEDRQMKTRWWEKQAVGARRVGQQTCQVKSWIVRKKWEKGLQNRRAANRKYVDRLMVSEFGETEYVTTNTYSREQEPESKLQAKFEGNNCSAFQALKMKNSTRKKWRIGNSLSSPFFFLFFQLRSINNISEKTCRTELTMMPIF